MTTKQLLWVAAVASILTIVCIAAIDVPFAQWIATRETYSRFWNEGIAYLEYPLGIEPYPLAGVWILAGGSVLTVAIPKLRRFAFTFLLLALVHLSARNVTMWMKFGFGRLRPVEWMKKGGDVWFRHGGFSFPSGHAILFGSIVIPLAVLYPRSRPLLAVLVFAMCARVAVGAHFLSDVLGGLALTCALTWLCVELLRRACPSLTPPAFRR
jgi:membrane-associated phospholipid phosphatase